MESSVDIPEGFEDAQGGPRLAGLPGFSGSGSRVFSFRFDTADTDESGNPKLKLQEKVRRHRLSIALQQGRILFFEGDDTKGDLVTGAWSSAAKENV
ncbi:hypothetical protein BaRGS_00006810 [Batillaria attramentaria]|uniref:Uncharacterized protein n=1 Tax=Batillaria attramentaria TaxID=370345 RepID=A0ABD0LRF7_9CAEN